MNRTIRNRSAITAAVAGFCLLTHSVRAGTYTTIGIDGNFSDWTNVPIAATSTPVAGDIDPIQLKMANDSNYIYFELTFNGAQNPNTGGGTLLAIDSDNNPSTGYAVYGSSLIGSNFGFQNDYPFTETASNYNTRDNGSTGTFANVSYGASPFGVATTNQEIAIPINASQTDTAMGGYTGPLFQTSNNSFTVEFYTDAAVLGPYTYTIAGPNPTWNITGSGDFNVPTNWTVPIVPNGPGATASFLSSITANHTVYSDTAITLGTLTFDNANTYVLAGAGSLTMNGSTGSASIIANSGLQKITLPTEIATNTTLNASSGATLIMGAPVTIDPGVSLTSTGAGTILFQSTITVGVGGSVSLSTASNALSLSLANASSAALIASSGTKSALQLQTLSLAAGSSFDMKGNDMVLHGGSLGAITAELLAGYNNGQWNGLGLQSSAAANDATHLTAIGVMQNANASGGAIYSSFDGVSLTAGDFLLKYTYYGDATLDGTVNSADYARIDNGYLGGLTGWANGDFNYDNVINGSDYTLIDNAFNMQGAGIGSSPSVEIAAQIAGATSVPEPMSGAMVALAAVGMLSRRRRTIAV